MQSGVREVGSNCSGVMFCEREIKITHSNLSLHKLLFFCCFFHLLGCELRCKMKEVVLYEKFYPTGKVLKTKYNNKYIYFKRLGFHYLFFPSCTSNKVEKLRK